MIWQQRKSMVLKNATLHIGNGEVLQGDMKIEDGKITEIGKSLSGGEVQDMTGKKRKKR